MTKIIKSVFKTYFEIEGDITYNTPFTMRELQCAIRADGNAAVGPDDIPYSIIRRLRGIYMATLLAIYKTIWSQVGYPKLWNADIIVSLLNSCNPVSYTHLDVYKRQI